MGARRSTRTMNRQHNCQIINFLQQPTQAKLFAPTFCSPTPFFGEVAISLSTIQSRPTPIVNFTSVLNGKRAVGDSLSLPNDQNKILNMKKQHTFRGSRTTDIIFFYTTSKTWVVPVSTGNF